VNVELPLFVLLSTVSHFTLLTYCSSNSTVSLQVVFCAVTDVQGNWWYVEFVVKMTKRRTDLKPLLRNLKF